MFPLFHIGNEVIYVYPLLVGFAWGLGFVLLDFFDQKFKLEIPNRKIFFLFNFILAWLGAKLLFVISASEYISMDIIKSENFWLGGGFVFYGGFLFGLVGTYIYAKYHKLELKKLSFLVIILCVGHAIGRVGCFMAGCCYGNFCELPWSVHLHGASRHPVQLYESFALLVLSFTLYKLWVKGFRSQLISIYLAGYGFIRFFLEFFRGDKIRGEFLELSTSQWLSILLIVISVILFRRAHKK